MQHKILSAMAFAKNIRSTVYLFKKLWKQRTTALLHAPRETDKTKIALDIAEEIGSQGKEVLYIDTQSRLSDHCERLAGIQGLSVLVPQFESPDDPTDYADIVISAIEEVVATTEIRTFIIDSVTRIAALSFGRNASAAYVMKRLVALQVRCGLSLLVIADDTTKATTRALTNLADTEFSEITENDECSIHHVGSRPVATAKEDSQSSKGFASVATGRDPTIESKKSAPSDKSDKSDSSTIGRGLTRQQRRALQRQEAKRMRSMKRQKIIIKP